jgi:hypothetical protein
LTDSNPDQAGRETEKRGARETEKGGGRKKPKVERGRRENTGREPEATR